MSLRPGSSSEIAWVKYRIAAASSPCGPPNCSSMRVASTGSGSETLTVYIRRLLCMNMAVSRISTEFLGRRHDGFPFDYLSMTRRAGGLLGKAASMVWLLAGAGKPQISARAGIDGQEFTDVC